MISEDNKKYIEKIINDFDMALESSNDEEIIYLMELCEKLYSPKVAKIKECVDEARDLYGTLSRNARIIRELLRQYLADNNDLNIFEIYKKYLYSYPKALTLYESSIFKYKEGIYNRNVLDDMRLSLELLTKELLNNNKSFENNISELSIKLQEKGIAGELRNILNIYKNYQNNCVKHNENINIYEIEYVMELTSIIIKLLVTTLG